MTGSGWLSYKADSEESARQIYGTGLAVMRATIYPYRVAYRAKD